MLSMKVQLVLALMLTAEASRRTKSHKGGKPDRTRPATNCPAAETRYGKCIPEHGDCGDGLRQATCKDRTEKIHCKIPRNWKRDLSDCRYKFRPWGSCDGATNTKTRSGTLNRALFNAECQTTVKVSKPCSPRVKKVRGDKKSNYRMKRTHQDYKKHS